MNNIFVTYYNFTNVTKRKKKLRSRSYLLQHILGKHGLSQLVVPGKGGRPADKAVNALSIGVLSTTFN